MKKKILYIAYYFPPVGSSGLPGAMRILKFLKYVDFDSFVLAHRFENLSERDCSIQLDIPDEKVLRVSSIDPFAKILKIQFNLKKHLKKELFNIKDDFVVKSNSIAYKDVSAKKSIFTRFKDFLYHLVYFPDPSSFWILPAFLAGRSVAKKNSIDVVFATGSPWSSLVVGYLVSISIGKPLIVDFRDPWNNNPFDASKGYIIDLMSKALESFIIHRAALVTLNTEPLRREFVARYPGQPENKFITIPNGFEFEGNVEKHEFDDFTGDFIIRHAGALYGLRDPSVLLEAILYANDCAAKAGSPRRWVFEQIGNVALNFDVSVKFKNMIDDGTLVIHKQLPYAECQEKIRTAHLLVNIQPGTKTQIPSKFYDYISARRPILNITPLSGALASVSLKYEIGSCFDADDVLGIRNYLVSRLNDTTWCNFESYPNVEHFNIANVADDLKSVVMSVLDDN